MDPLCEYDIVIEMEQVEYMQQEEEEEDSLEVERITAKRVNDMGTEYFILWKGFQSKEGSWESLRDLQNSLGFVQEYEDKIRLIKKKRLTKQYFNFKIRKQRKRYLKERVRSVKEINAIMKKKPLRQPCCTLDINFTKTPTLLQNLLERPQADLMTVRRYSPAKRKWLSKIQLVGEVVGKVAALEKKAFPLNNLIVILGVTELGGRLVVRFERQGENYQSDLDHLKQTNPREVIDFLLSRFDPSTSKLKEIGELKTFIELSMKESQQQFASGVDLSE